MRTAISLPYEREIDHESLGKWVVRGKRGEIGGLFKRARELVSQDQLYEVKFVKSRRKGLYVLMVYADREHKQEIKERLESVGINPFWWISNPPLARRKPQRLERVVFKFA